MIDTAQSRRRLLPLFLATTVVPLACLIWLGWRVVEEDRVLQVRRSQEQRDQAAALAASALQRVLAVAEERLATFSAAPSASGNDIEEGMALLAFGREGAIAHAGTPLPYYPVPPKSPELNDSARFAAADELEFQKKDLAGALRALEAIAAGGNPALRAEALLRLATMQRRNGKTLEALRTFAELGKLGGVRIEQGPAALVAHKGRALIFKSTGRRAELESEAERLCDDLESGRWILSQSEFDFNYEQAREWLSASRPPIDPDRLALAEAATALWHDSQNSAERTPSGRNWRTLRAGGLSIPALTRSAQDRGAALLMTPRFLESSWLSAWSSAEQVQGFEFALSDADGRAVLGNPGAPIEMQSIQAPPATQLPWTLHVIARRTGPAPGLSSQTKFVLAGIVMMAVLALAVGYVICRTISRELRVARLQSDFVAAVSHEFRTPLTTVRQLAEMLTKGRVSSDERRQQFYETLLRESERLQKLVEGLLDFGRMEAGQLRYRFERVDPEEFVRGIVSEFQEEVAGRGYHVELHGDGGLPPIRADRESLSRVFWNLLDNAVKYSPENRTVWVDLSEAGRRLAVRVRDRGIGIPATEQKEIFKKFVRGVASKNASIQGTGVGLAMARQIVLAHGGDISVESRPGEGSVFTVMLPVAET